VAVISKSDTKTTISKSRQMIVIDAAESGSETSRAIWSSPIVFSSIPASRSAGYLVKGWKQMQQSVSKTPALLNSTTDTSSFEYVVLRLTPLLVPMGERSAKCFASAIAQDFT
jgi:hypothetical protein